MTFLNYTIKKGNQKKKQISTIRYHFVSIRLVKRERCLILIVSMDMRQMTQVPSYTASESKYWCIHPRNHSGWQSSNP